MSRLIFFATLASIAQIAISQTYPSCANSCIFNTSFASSAGCLPTDSYCLCSSSIFIQEAVCCIRASCGSTDQSNAYSTAVYNCGTWGVTLVSLRSISCSSVATSSHANSLPTTSSYTYTPSNSNYRSKNKGISTGIRAAIGLGITLVGGIIVGIACLFILRKQRAKKNAIEAANAQRASAFMGGNQGGGGGGGGGLEVKGGAQAGVNAIPPPYTASSPGIGLGSQQPGFQAQPGLQAVYPQPQSQPQSQGQLPVYPPQQQQQAPVFPHYGNIQSPISPMSSPSPPQNGGMELQGHAISSSPPPQNQNENHGMELYGSPIARGPPQQQQQQGGFQGVELPSGNTQPRHELS
ncbi:uncharacterized protein BDR25DRAFT_115179 [Lindgomyces ingoldianus]|uniref:Uncharacterized protein n=1 Tax=Lindgomyces ingoldianus TaxID=673940 RepID=A0ACB6Q9T5_9PLEO|nr:uncharacterized protein BDR25DRAFT_115179 [Lindgomyces ingoldianus]KAF2463300.1 hypothetical protein BDR25DRAFT_115179 [Lindgomyces ingoldianus]